LEQQWSGRYRCFLFFSLLFFHLYLTR
jgi:hypothetical protein